MKWLPALLLTFLCSVILPASAQSQTESQGAAPDSTPLTADAIMAKVAANQDRSELARKRYVYHQHIHVVTKKTNGKLMREETTDYHMVPEAEQNRAAAGEDDWKVLAKGQVRRVCG